MTLIKIDVDVAITYDEIPYKVIVKLYTSYYVP